MKHKKFKEDSEISQPSMGQPAFTSGRSDKQIEEMSTVAGVVAPVATPVGKMQKRTKGSIFSGISTSEKFPNSKAVKEDQLSEEDVILMPGQGRRFKPGLMSKRTDNEVEMARNDLYQTAKDAKHVCDMLQSVSEMQGLDGWVQAKITKAADYLSSVRKYLEGKTAEVDEGWKSRLAGVALTAGIDAYARAQEKKKQAQQATASNQANVEETYQKMTPREKFNRGLKRQGFDPEAAAERLEKLLAKQKREREEFEKAMPYVYGKKDDDENLSEENLEENLHKWFKEKWVRFNPQGKIMGPCARGDDSEGKPKCLPQSKAHSLGKKGRASAAARKRREDPNPERSGPAKNVATKKKSNEDVAEDWSQKYKDSINCSNPKGFSQKAHCAGKKKTNEEQLEELKCWSGYHRVKDRPAGSPGSCAKNTNEEVIEGHEMCPECGGAMYSEEMINEKKDACYYKVKSRYKVWPSAYASGALVKCRNKGAKNWGNKSK